MGKTFLKIIFRVGMITAMVLPLLPAMASADNYPAMISKVRGEVVVIRQGRTQEIAKAGTHLSEADEIRTGENAYAEILLDENAGAGRLEVHEKSHLRLRALQKKSDTGERITLLQEAIGKVNVHVQKLKGDSKFEVETPTATTGVRGTDFTVEVRETGKK